jgi:formylglycine-generating enzyme required for sulfatase activity
MQRKSRGFLAGLAFLIAATAALSGASAFAAPGNVDGIGDVDLRDVVLSLQVVAGLNPDGVSTGGDADGDNAVGLAEAIYGLQFVSGIRHALSPESRSFDASGGTGSIGVTAAAGSSWTAASNAGWISVTFGASGSGNGTVGYSVAANTGTSSRTGTLTVAGRTFKVEQAGKDGGDGFTNYLGMEFAWIPAGTFTMGSPADEPGRLTDESQHQVTLTQDFYMMTTEVTQAQWEAVMGSNPSRFTVCGGDCPVERVSWEDVQDFIAALSAMDGRTYRLPTEAEWEYAARAGTTTAFYSGGITNAEWSSCIPLDPNLDLIGWYCGNDKVDGTSTTHPVAQKQPNAFGLYDTSGNVWEWVQDWSGSYPDGAVVNPTGPDSGSVRVVRGGSWEYDARSCRSARRSSSTPSYRSYYTGFRLALSPAESCAHAISPESRSLGVSGGTGNISVTAPAGCAWTAASNAGWISVTSGASSSGNGTVSYSVAANTGTSSRTGTLTVAGRIFTVEQAGQIGGDRFTNFLGMEFVRIPAGTFMMGSPVDEPGWSSDEILHQVTLTQDYYMMTTEVTQAQWETVMGSNPSYFTACGGDCPVDSVSWNDIQDFIAALNAMDGQTYRLPAEAEWEYAARAGTTTAFYNGGITHAGVSPVDPNLDEIGWYWGNSDVSYSPNYSGFGTHPVARKQPNAFGLYDISGNTYEWVMDWYESYPDTAVTDPAGPGTGSARVLRGGSWASQAWYCSSANRISSDPSDRSSYNGFRLALSPGQ